MFSPTLVDQQAKYAENKALKDTAYEFTSHGAASIQW